MSVTATEPTVTIVRHETNPATILTDLFTEQQGVDRLEELAETLDFPLDFQI